MKRLFISLGEHWLDRIAPFAWMAFMAWAIAVDVMKPLVTPKWYTFDWKLQEVRDGMVNSIEPDQEDEPDDPNHGDAARSRTAMNFMVWS